MKEAYLKDVYRTIYLKDIIERNRLQNSAGLEQIFKVLASAMGSAVNPAKIANTFKSATDIKISTHTITKYIEHLEDAFWKVVISGDYMRGFYNDDGIYRIGVYEFLLNRDCLDE